MKNFTTTMAVLCLTACSTASKPNIALGPNGPVGPNQKALLGKDLPAGLAQTYSAQKTPHKLFEKLYHQSHCAELPRVQLQNNTMKKRGCLTYETSTSVEKSTAMLNSGFAYSELLCDRYFNALANRNQDLGFGIQSFGLLSGFTTSVLGITGSPAKSIALVSAGFAGTIAGMESYQQNYHFGPDVSAVRKLIMDGQRNYKNTITSTNLTTLNHYQAISHIKRHQAICQVDTIKAWVTAAVEKQEIRFDNTRLDNFYANSSLVDAANKIRNEANIPGALPTSQLVNILWLYEMTPSPEIIENHIRPGLGDQLAPSFLSESTDASGKKSYTLRYNAEISNILRNLSANARNGLQKAVDIRDQKAKENPDKEMTPKEQQEINAITDTAVQPDTVDINASMKTREDQ